MIVLIKLLKNVVNHIYHYLIFVIIYIDPIWNYFIINN